MLDGEGIGAHSARGSREQEAHGEQHHLGHASRSARYEDHWGPDLIEGAFVRRRHRAQPCWGRPERWSAAQVLEGELRARDEQLRITGASHYVSNILAGQETPLFDQVQPVQGGEASSGDAAREAGRRPPVHRQALVEGCATSPHRLRQRPDRCVVRLPERILQDQTEVDVAHDRTEAAVGQAA